jgi:hypothetical protein
MNNTSHNTHVLKDKIEKLESRGKQIQFCWIPGHCGVNEWADLEVKQSIKDGRDNQLLLPVADLKAQWKKKDKGELHSFCQNTKRDRGKNYFETYNRNDSSPWFREIKTYSRAFVSLGHSNLKASLNRFNIVSTAECECGDRMQTAGIVNCTRTNGQQ